MVQITPYLFPIKVSIDSYIHCLTLLNVIGKINTLMDIKQSNNKVCTDRMYK